MPTAHGFTVNVVTADGQKFPEYGHQTPSGSSPRSTSKTVSTKIQAKDGQKFCIMVDVKHPFPYLEKEKKDRLALTSLNSKESGGVGNGNGSSIGRYNLRSSLKQHQGDGPGEPAKRTHRSIDKGEKGKHQNSVSSEKLPFILVAWVFVDGNRVPECSQILYTDPKKSPFLLRGRYTAAPASQGLLTSGSAQDIVIQDWVFTPVGIEVLLSKMNIGAPDPKPVANTADEKLDEVIQGLAEVNAAQRHKSGQIEVRITRIVDMGRTHSNWRREQPEQRAMEDTETTHIISIRKSQLRMRVEACAWSPYDDTEEYYAKFIFQYMGIEKLVNLGLCTADGKPTNQRELKAALSLPANRVSAAVSPLKRPKRPNVESSGRPGSSDEEEQDWVDTSSTDDSDRPRKRHEAVITNSQQGTSKKWFGHHKKPSDVRSSLSLLPKSGHDEAGQRRMQLVIRAGRTRNGAENQGSRLELVEPEQGKDDLGEGPKLALVEVEAEDGGEGKIE